MDTKSMYDRVVIVMVDFHLPGTKRTIASDKFNSDADKDMLSAAKVIFESDTLKEIRITYYALKTLLRSKCLPSMAREGMYLVPMDNVSLVDEALKEARATTQKLAREFKREYPDLMARAKKRLRSEFNKDDYVSADRIESEFGIDWRFVEFNTPTKLKTISAELYDQEKQKVRESMRETEMAIQALLRERFAAVIERLADKLQSDADGERKTFRNSLIEKAEAFFDDFKTLNVTDDKALDALVVKAKKVIKGVDAEALRGDDVLRERTATAFEKIQTQLNSMISDAPRRRIKIETKKAA